MAPGKKVDAADIAAPFRAEIRARVEQLKQMGVEPPLLVGLLANKDPAALKYAEWTGRACRADGLRYELRSVSDAVDVEDKLFDCNDDPRVHGVIVYYPIFGSDKEPTFSGQSRDEFLRDAVSVTKDVEGLCHTYRTNLYRNIRYLDPPRNQQKCLLPCTPLAVVKILENTPSGCDKSKPTGRHMEGVTVTIINRSEIVGRPLAALLANDGATVYSVDVDSIHLLRPHSRMHINLTSSGSEDTVESCVKRSGVVITGVPTKSYRLDTAWIQPGTVVVNVASYKNVDEAKLLQIEDVTYVPMVGKVTVAMLERNLVRLFDNFHKPPHLQGDWGTMSVSSVDSEEQYRRSRRMEQGYGKALLVYNAVALTLLLVVTVTKSSKKH